MRFLDWNGDGRIDPVDIGISIVYDNANQDNSHEFERIHKSDSGVALEKPVLENSYITDVPYKKCSTCGQYMAESTFDTCFACRSKIKSGGFSLGISTLNKIKNLLSKSYP